jgi:hypothetical protein
VVFPLIGDIGLVEVRGGRAPQRREVRLMLLIERRWNRRPRSLGRGLSSVSALPCSSTIRRANVFTWEPPLRSRVRRDSSSAKRLLFEALVKKSSSALKSPAHAGATNETRPMTPRGNVRAMALVSVDIGRGKLQRDAGFFSG